MNNFERLKQMDIKEMTKKFAKLLENKECQYCPIREMCSQKDFGSCYEAVSVILLEEYKE